MQYVSYWLRGLPISLPVGLFAYLLGTNCLILSFVDLWVRCFGFTVFGRCDVVVFSCGLVRSCMLVELALRVSWVCRGGSFWGVWLADFGLV